MKRLALLAIGSVLLLGACSKMSHSPTKPDVAAIEQPKPELPASMLRMPEIAAADVPLQNNVPVTNLSDVAGGLKNFALVVPAGQSTAVFKIAGGTGDCDIYVRYGSQPTTTLYDYRPYTSTNNETVTVSNPAAGTWYVMLRGYASYSGVTLVASYAVGKPDLTVYMGSANPWVETRTFASNDCSVLEGTVVAGTRRLLRFSAEARNAGTADIFLGAPADHPEWFEYDSCHGHYHFHGFFQYRLLDGSDLLVAGGAKVAFCVEDFQKWKSGAPAAKYTCANQGLQVGWADIYGGTLDGQWIDITDVAAGTYTLELVVDPNDQFAETNESNNSGRMSVTIPPATGGTPTTLESGVPVSSISGASGSDLYYKITVPAGASNLSVTTSGGSGDVDLYVRKGAQPTTTVYDFRSWNNSNSESVSASFPSAGDWFITLHGYKAFSGATLVATVTTGSTEPPSLQSGVPVTGLSGAVGSNTFYKITVTSGSPVLNISTSGGSGDVDLYVKFGVQPTTSNFDYRSWTYTNAENVSISAPRTGDWYITLRGFAAYSGVTLVGSLSPVAALASRTPNLQPIYKQQQ